MIRRFRRALRRHSGISARRVAVRTHRPWHWLLLAALMLLAGYGLGYRQFGSQPSEAGSEQLKQENKALQQSLVHLAQQAQVNVAAQRNLAREMAVLQEESMRLKEDVAFYKSILADDDSGNVTRIHSIKLTPGARPREYRYQILLVQAGRHDKPVQGSLRLVLQTLQAGKPSLQAINPAGVAAGGRLSFKFYQRIEGTLVVPEHQVGQSLQVEFLPAGAKMQKMVKSVIFPG